VSVDFLEAAPERDEGVVLRALLDDARFPFVVLAAAGGPYELVGEDGDPDRHGGVVLVEPRADAPDDGRFAGQQGYLGARLLRRVDGGEPRFVALTRWSSPLMVARAGALRGGGPAALYTVVGR
jgi:hypothetical protein